MCFICFYALLKDPCFYDDDDDECSLNDGGDYKRTWLDNQNISQCLTSTLKVVEMNNFTGAVNEVLMLRFLICNGSVLKRVSINVDKRFGNAVLILKVIRYCRKVEEHVMTIPRASNDLEILFCYWTKSYCVILLCMLFLNVRTWFELFWKKASINNTRFD